MSLLDKLTSSVAKKGLGKITSLISSKLGSPVKIEDSASIGKKITEKATKAKETLGSQLTPAGDASGGAERKKTLDEPRDTPDLYAGVPPDIVYDNNKFVTNPYEYVLTESIDDMYRSGYMLLIDKFGMTEQAGFLNSFDVDKWEIVWGNKIEENLSRRIQVGLYDMAKIQEFGNFENRKRNVSYGLYEEPFYTNLSKRRLGDPYVYTTAPDIISDVLIKYVLEPNAELHVVKGNDDPKIPSFINPNWTPEKTIRYMQNYGDAGPIKVFNITRNGKTVTVVAPLQKLVANEVFPIKQVMFPSVTGDVEGGIKLPDNYVIRGVTANDRKNDLQGRSMLTFDYFYGNNNELILPDFPDKEESDFTYRGDFEKRKRSYASIISGDYRYGTEIVSKTGNYLLHKKDVFREHRHQFHMDIESKPLVQTKLLNKFYNSFYDELLLEVTLPGYSEIHCGQTFEIFLPSINRDTENESTWDETLSGDWLLIKMEHKFWTPPKGEYKYQIKCYFVKTGLEYTDRELADKV